MTRYDWIYALGLPAAIPYLAWRRVRRGKYTESAGGMCGRRLPQGPDAERFAEGSLWLHAVSVGEVTVARSVASGLRALQPERPLVVSTITETGQAAARRAFEGETTTYFPLDFSGNVRRFQDAFQPRVFVLMETELWPNFLTMAARRGTQCFMINAKLSDRSFPRYRRVRRFLRPVIASLSGVCAQTDLDAERFRALGVPPERVRVTGNCKFDLPGQALDETERRDLAAQLGLSDARRWIVVGSTHPGEEDIMLEAFGAVRERFADVGLLLCPRHPERFDEVAERTARTDWRVGRASTPNAQADPEVVVLDRMGVLARAYGLGVATVVAGSFCPTGGHSILEPAVHGVPVVFGPDMHSQREMHRLFREAGAGLQVEADALAETLIRLLDDETWRRAQGQKALEVALRNGGAAARSIEAVAEWLGATAAG